MSGMTAAVRETRGSNELAIQRAAANEVTDPDAYEVQKRRAVLATLDWLEGRTALAPVTGDPVEPDEDAIVTERLRAEDVEERALRSGLDGTYPGMCGVVLSWFHRRPFTEAPY